MAKRGPKTKPKTDTINGDDVIKLAGYGCTQTEIADYFGVDKSTISRNFSTEFIKGREACKQRLRQKQFDSAMKGNVTMLIWLGKQMLDQKEPKQEQEHTGEIKVNIVNYAK